MIIGIVPARGNSKGIKEKNIIPFCGKPLIYWTIKQALKSRIEKIYVSTDNEKIAKIASEYGAEIAARPSRIAEDRSSSEEAILYTLSDKNVKDSDIIVFLQCTSPLRYVEDIDSCINTLLNDKSIDCVFSVSELKDSTIWKLDNDWKLKGALFDPDKRNIMRQQREKYFYENGSIYCFYSEGIKEHHNRIHGDNCALYKMPFWKSFEIDEHEDIELCEFYFEKKGLKCY